jgi:hypothetical protein
VLDREDFLGVWNWGRKDRRILPRSPRCVKMKRNAVVVPFDLHRYFVFFFICWPCSVLALEWAMVLPQSPP